MKNLLLFILIVLWASSTGATTHYITPAGAGDAGGSNWSNACASFTGSCAPSSMVRGDTYVVAGGNYTSAVAFNKAVSGTTYIYVRKAQSGTYNGVAYNDDLVAGWDSSYQTTQAVFSPSSSSTIIWNISTGYWDFDGVTPSTLWAKSGYGIKIVPTATAASLRCIQMGGTSSNVSIKHIEIANYGSSSDVEQWNVFTDKDSHTISSNYIYNCGNCVRINGPGSSNTIEYNVFGNTWYSSSHHSETIGFDSATGTPSTTTIRYNLFDHSDNGDTTGFIIDLGYAGDTNDSVLIYGNVFVDLTGHNGFGSGNSSNPATLTNWKFYNNTFVDSTVDFCALSTGSELRNNLFYNSTAEVFSGSGPSTRTNNYWNNSTNSLGTCTNCVTSTESTSVLFSNYAGGDYRLGSASSEARNAGYTLSSPYNADAYGSTRGSDGTFDIGAYEYNSSATVPTVQGVTIQGATIK